MFFCWHRFSSFSALVFYPFCSYLCWPDRFLLSRFFFLSVLVLYINNNTSKELKNDELSCFGKHTKKLSKNFLYLLTQTQIFFLLQTKLDLFVTIFVYLSSLLAYIACLKSATEKRLNQHKTVLTSLKKWESAKKQSFIRVLINYYCLTNFPMCRFRW